jgi:AraC family transcriptional regulator
MGVKRDHFRSRVADAFGMHDAPTLTTRELHKSTLAVTELRYDAHDFGKTTPIPREDAYLIALQFRPCHDHDLYFDGHKVRPTNWFPGVTTIYDLRRDPLADLRDPFHSLMFYLPRKALDALAHEAGTPGIGDLRHELGVGIDDPVVRHLLSSLLPAMAKPEEVPPLFLDHVALALSAHVACVYGNMRPAKSRGGLAPWQERRAKELMCEALDGEVPLSRLATECGLSVGYFVRAFRQSTGFSPHRWLLLQRVARAKDLLRNRNVPLAEIAYLCGFANQSHLSRVFRAFTGFPPGKWRHGRS